LLAQTGGNPLFLQHLIENWRVTRLTREIMEPSAPPPWQRLVTARPSAGLSGAIDHHLELVSAPCRELLRVAAGLGTEFSAGILTRVAAQTPAAASVQLEEATSSGLIREASERGRYRFTHVLIRDGLYAQLSAAERSQLHGRAGAALEAQGVGDNAVLLAE